MEVLHGIFTVFKFLFGLGALGGLATMAGLVLWFLVHLMVRGALRRQPAHCCPGLRKLFLES